jgi:hypothetical protein
VVQPRLPEQPSCSRQFLDPGVDMGAQSNWRFCVKCFGLFWYGYPTKGTCPRGGGHDPGGSWDFSLVVLDTNPPAPNPGGGGSGPPVQSNWRFCTKCFGLFWYGYQTAGSCPLGGAHSPHRSASPTGAWSSINLGLPVVDTNAPPARAGGGGTGVPRQSNWRFCTKCFGLFWYGYSSAGQCPTGGEHSPHQSASPSGAGSSWNFGLDVVTTLPATGRLWLNEEHQQQTQWCWAASSVSIAKFYDPSSTWSQCSLVNQAFGQTSCCTNGSSAACNQPWYPEKSLPIVGHFDAKVNGKPTFQKVQEMITARRPISVNVQWNGGGGHNPVVDGFDTTGTIVVQDPWYGASVQNFDAFPSQYNGGGSWYCSYYTK